MLVMLLLCNLFGVWWQGSSHAWNLNLGINPFLLPKKYWWCMVSRLSRYTRKICWTSLSNWFICKSGFSMHKDYIFPKDWKNKLTRHGREWYAFKCRWLDSVHCFIQILICYLTITVHSNYLMECFLVEEICILFLLNDKVLFQSTWYDDVDF